MDLKNEAVFYEQQNNVQKAEQNSPKYPIYIQAFDKDWLLKIIDREHFVQVYKDGIRFEIKFCENERIVEEWVDDLDKDSENIKIVEPEIFYQSYIRIMKELGGKVI